MHHIYHTEGIILDSKNYGEAGKCYYIFTRELGMVFASAQGVRKIESRLRYVLQDYAYIKVDLVRGRDFWRITSASKIEDVVGIRSDIEKIRIFARVCSLVRKLVVGEETNQLIFEDLLAGMRALLGVKNNTEAMDIEVVLVLRILRHLGYIGDMSKEADLLESPIGEELILNVSKNRKDILRQINRALRETHL